VGEGVREAIGNRLVLEQTRWPNCVGILSRGYSTLVASRHAAHLKAARLWGDKHPIISGSVGDGDIYY
jgi:hypothetical protein